MPYRWRYCVGDRLDAGECRASVGEGAQQEEQADGLEGVRRRDGMLCRDGPAAGEADDDYGEDGQYEDRSGKDEQPGAVCDAAQVDGGDEEEHGEAQPRRVGQQSRERRGQCGHARRDRHGDVEDVVDDQ